MDLRSKRHKRQAEFHNSALNDILFILLLFFLIVSTLANPNVIKMTLPKATSNTKARQTVVVSINEKHEFYVGTRQVPFERLKDTLVPALSNEKLEPTIVINAEKSVPVEYIVDVMEIANKLGAKVVLATKKPS
ncbi:MAG: ExbD/TolR family protein [Bacteroidota bacterium]